MSAPGPYLEPPLGPPGAVAPPEELDGPGRHRLVAEAEDPGGQEGQKSRRHLRVDRLGGLEQRGDASEVVALRKR